MFLKKKKRILFFLSKTPGFTGFTQMPTGFRLVSLWFRRFHTNTMKNGMQKTAAIFFHVFCCFVDAGGKTTLHGTRNV